MQPRRNQSCAGRVWETKTGNRLSALISYRVTRLALSANDSQLAAARADGAIDVFDMEKGTLITTLRGHTDR